MTFLQSLRLTKPTNHDARRYLLSASVTYLSAPYVRTWLLRFGSVDHPNHRSSHTSPVPRGGGLACALGMTAAAVTLPNRLPCRQVVAIAAMAALGFTDDQVGLPAKWRLGAQIASATAVPNKPSLTCTPAAALLMSSVVNVVNFMDGINGITGVTAILWGTNSMTDIGADPTSRALGAVVAGSALGFLPHNFPTARLFMGDVGSYLIGSVITVSLTNSLHNPASAKRLAAPLIPYFADATFCLARRWLGGQTLTEAHRDHTYQQLVHLCGLSHPVTTTIHTAAALICTGIERSNGGPARRIAYLVVVPLYLALPKLLIRYRRASAHTPTSSIRPNEST